MKLDNIQGYLSLGYLYLLGLGIINETFYYNSLGINFLEYSSILDILVSPIAKITERPYILVILMVMLVLFFVLPITLAKSKAMGWFKKMFKKLHNAKEAEVKKSIRGLLMMGMACFLFGILMGIGSGRGERLKEKIMNGTLEYPDKITYVDNTSAQVKIAGKNSTYIFYLIKGNKSLQISPINGVVKRIEENR